MGSKAAKTNINAFYQLKKKTFPIMILEIIIIESRNNICKVRRSGSSGFALNNLMCQNLDRKIFKKCSDGRENENQDHTDTKLQTFKSLL